MLIIEKRVAELLWGKAILDAQETVLTPELIEEIEQDRTEVAPVFRGICPSLSPPHAKTTRPL